MKLTKANVHLFRVPIETPITTSFGIMRDRSCLLVRLEDSDGCHGWGEAWCNFPAVGAEHRALLLTDSIFPVLQTLEACSTPDSIWEQLTVAFRVLAIQSGEPGPFAQCIAALDCAVWDMAARRQSLPLYKFLSPTAKGSVPIYASGINPTEVETRVEDAVKSGIQACKLKVGFGLECDIRNVELARRILGDDGELFVDANQAWDPIRTADFLRASAEYGLGWLEEPLAHDAVDADWRRVADTTSVPIAAGENYGSMVEFERAPLQRRIRVLQPDLGKWGGVTGMVKVAKFAAENDLLFCPHWLGGGVGLLASVHVKAAFECGNGFVEVDVNPNKARDVILDCTDVSICGGVVNLPTVAGTSNTDEAISRLIPFACPISQEIRLCGPVLGCDTASISENSWQLR